MGRVVHTHAVHIARRHAAGAGQGHEQAVEVGALAAQVAGGQHRLHVARATAAHAAHALAVGHDPVVDGAGFLDIGARLGVAHDLARGFCHDAVQGLVFAGLPPGAQGLGAGVGGRRHRAQIGGTVAQGHAGGQRELLRGVGVGPFDGQHTGTGVAGHHLGLLRAGGVETDVLQTLVGTRAVAQLLRRQRHPDTAQGGALAQVDGGGDVIGAPALFGAGGQAARTGQHRHEGGAEQRRCTRQVEEMTALHGALLVCGWR